MQIYLPIAEMSVNVFLILGLGGAIGFLSGVFGIGGGFLMTPMLIFIGIPSTVSVSTQANQTVASSVSGVLAHWRRNNVDFKMGMILLGGGVTGSTTGVWLFTLLRGIGQIDLVIKISYVVMLSIIGALMFTESIRAMVRIKHRKAVKRHHHTWVHGLPFKMRFRRSRLYISVLLPIAIGFNVGVLSGFLGIGGGFVMIPAMIYILGMPTSVVVGTSLFQAIFVTANVTFLQSVNNQTVDIALALLLLAGGVVGAQFGARVSYKLPAEHLRGLLALLVLGVCAMLIFDLVVVPEEIFSLGG